MISVVCPKLGLLIFHFLCTIDLRNIRSWLSDHHLTTNFYAFFSKINSTTSRTPLTKMPFLLVKKITHNRFLHRTHMLAPHPVADAATTKCFFQIKVLLTPPSALRPPFSLSLSLSLALDSSTNWQTTPEKYNPPSDISMILPLHWQQWCPCYHSCANGRRLHTSQR